jgi:hypothetical protein
LKLSLVESRWFLGNQTVYVHIPTDAHLCDLNVYLFLQPESFIARICCGDALLLIAYAYVYGHCGAIIVRLLHVVFALPYQSIVRGPNNPILRA